MAATEDQTWFIKENAVSIVSELRAKNKRLVKELVRLQASRRGLKENFARYRKQVEERNRMYTILKHRDTNRDGQLMDEPEVLGMCTIDVLRSSYPGQQLDEIAISSGDIVLIGSDLIAVPHDVKPFDPSLYPVGE